MAWPPGWAGAEASSNRIAACTRASWPAATTMPSTWPGPVARSRPPACTPRLQPGKPVNPVFCGGGARLRARGLIAHHHRNALQRHGVQVRQLCPQSIRLSAIGPAFSGLCRQSRPRAHEHDQRGHRQRPGPTPPCPCHRESLAADRGKTPTMLLTAQPALAAGSGGAESRLLAARMDQKVTNSAILCPIR